METVTFNQVFIAFSCRYGLSLVATTDRCLCFWKRFADAESVTPVRFPRPRFPPRVEGTAFR